MRKALRGFAVVALVASGSTAVQASGPETRPPEIRLEHLTPGPAPLALPFSGTHLGARWHGDHDGVVEIRTATATTTSPWSRWRTLGVAHDLEDEATGLVYSGLVRIDGATRLQARHGDGVAALELVLIDAGDSPAIPVQGPSGAPGAPGAPEIVTRAGWGADERMRKGNPKHAPVSKLVVHHTVTPNDDPDPASTVRAIYAFHTRSRGWDDIGYNFLVDHTGRVYEGRFARAYPPGETPTGEDGSGRGVIGAHARGFNQGSAGFAMLGDFSRDVGPAPAAFDGLVRLAAWRAGARNINPEGSDPYTGAGGRTSTFPNISGHRDLGSTSCPGDRLYGRLPELRRKVADALAGRYPQPAPAPPEPAPAPLPVPEPPAVPVPGWWAAGGDGRVEAVGEAPSEGDMGSGPLNAPIVAMAATRSRDGYWLAGADGGVFAFGNAPFLGSATGRLKAPVVHLEPTPSGKGYWVVSRSGEVAGFGDAAALGRAGGLPVEIAGMAATPTGTGYWLAAADGRVFAFGDAMVTSAAGGRAATEVKGVARPGTPIVSIAASRDGRGYWLLGSDGGVFSVGVPFHGSVPARQAKTEAVQLRVSEDGGGYYVAGADGALFAFGDADTRRERPGGPGAVVVDAALRPTADATSAEEGKPWPSVTERAGLQASSGV
ncbi:MAG: N-acetylmuramoyl-L-alanine amidase [Acidimicrobiia bacterium]